MSVAGIGATGLSQLSNIQRNYQQVRGEFSQLGQDLQAGNLSQAQSDFVSLAESIAVQFGSSSPVSTALNTVGHALHGNLPLSRQASAARANSSTANSGLNRTQPAATQNNLTQMLNQLGQALQSGNLSAAQQAYCAAQQVWQQAPPGATGSPTTTTGFTL